MKKSYEGFAMVFRWVVVGNDFIHYRVADINFF